MVPRYDMAFVTYDPNVSLLSRFSLLLLRSIFSFSLSFGVLNREVLFSRRFSCFFNFCGSYCCYYSFEVRKGERFRIALCDLGVVVLEVRNLEEEGEKEGWKEITRDLKHDQFSATCIYFFLFLIFSYFRARARPLEHYSRKTRLYRIRALWFHPIPHFLLDNRRTSVKNHSAVPSRHDPLETSLVGSLFEATADRLSKVVAFSVSKLEIRLDHKIFPSRSSRLRDVSFWLAQNFLNDFN